MPVLSPESRDHRTPLLLLGSPVAPSSALQFAVSRSLQGACALTYLHIARSATRGAPDLEQLFFWLTHRAKRLLGPLAGNKHVASANAHFLCQRAPCGCRLGIDEAFWLPSCRTASSAQVPWSFIPSPSPALKCTEAGLSLSCRKLAPSSHSALCTSFLTWAHQLRSAYVH